MNLKLTPTSSTQQIKEEQISFLLEDVEGAKYCKVPKNVTTPL